MRTTFTVEANDEVKVASYDRYRVQLTFEADPVDLLRQISIEEVAEYYSAIDLLNQIGADKAMDHFNLVEPT